MINICTIVYVDVICTQERMNAYDQIGILHINCLAGFLNVQQHVHMLERLVF